MKKTSILSAFLFSGLLLGGTATNASAETWTVDKGHSTVGFSVAHLVVTKTKGRFNEFSGTVNLDPKNPAKSSVEVSVDVASVDTNDEKRDGHLKSPDFFDAAKHPKMTFKSTKVVKVGKGLKVSGNLTLHGVTKPVTLNVTGPSKEIKDPWGNTRRAASATAKINRKDFGLNWNQALDGGGFVVGDEVTIELEVELIKSK